MTDFWTKSAIITPNQSLLTHMTATVIIWSVNIGVNAFQEFFQGVLKRGVFFGGGGP